MNTLISRHNSVFGLVERTSSFLLPTLARFSFAAVLLIYYWQSALTKLGDGFLGFLFPADGAYIQIFPKAMAAASYDSSQLGVLHWLIATAGMWAEFILPVLIVLGLFSRLSSIAMIGFTVVQSLTDIYGHGLSDANTLGLWFDANPSSIIMDQRLLWITVLVIIVVKGGGPLSLDRLLGRLS